MDRELQFKTELESLCKKYYGDNWVYDNIKEEGDSSGYTVWMKLIVWYNKQDELKKQQSYLENYRERYESKGEM